VAAGGCRGFTLIELLVLIALLLYTQGTKRSRSAHGISVNGATIRHRLWPGRGYIGPTAAVIHSQAQHTTRAACRALRLTAAGRPASDPSIQTRRSPERMASIPGAPSSENDLERSCAHCKEVECVVLPPASHTCRAPATIVPESAPPRATKQPRHGDDHRQHQRAESPARHASPSSVAS
jgi:hypothetical protein